MTVPSGMRHLKLKAVSEVTALRKSLEEAQASRKASEEELAKMQEAISRASLKVCGWGQEWGGAGMYP